MKTTFVIISILLACSQFQSRKHHKKTQIIEFNKIADDTMLNTWIRNRGTYVYQVLNIQADEAKAKELKEKLDPMDEVKYDDPSQSVYNSDKIELPVICEEKWKSNKDIKIQVLEKATEFMTNWLDQSDKKGASNKETFNNMPSLDKDQFAKFYSYWVTGVTDFSGKEGDKDISYFNGDDATKESQNLLKEVNFDLMGKFQKVGWLQFWVYMCSEGKKPKLQEYLSESDLRAAHNNVAQDKNNEDKAKVVAVPVAAVPSPAAVPPVAAPKPAEPPAPKPADPPAPPAKLLKKNQDLKTNDTKNYDLKKNQTNKNDPKTNDLKTNDKNKNKNRMMKKTHLKNKIHKHHLKQ